MTVLSRGARNCRGVAGRAGLPLTGLVGLAILASSTLVSPTGWNCCGWR